MTIKSFIEHDMLILPFLTCWSLIALFSLKKQRFGWPSYFFSDVVLIKSNHKRLYMAKGFEQDAGIRPFTINASLDRITICTRCTGLVLHNNDIIYVKLKQSIIDSLISFIHAFIHKYMPAFMHICTYFIPNSQPLVNFTVVQRMDDAAMYTAVCTLEDFAGMSNITIRPHSKANAVKLKSGSLNTFLENDAFHLLLI